MEGFREKIHYNYFHNGEKMSKDVVFFLARTSQKKITISFEHKDSFWLPYEEALQKVTFQNAKDILRKNISFLESIFIEFEKEI
jgi:hypothetical protein